MQDVDQACFQELCFRNRCGYPDNGFGFKENGSFRQRLDVSAEPERFEILDEARSEACCGGQILPVILCEAHPFNEGEKCFEPGEKEKTPIFRKPSDEEPKTATSCIPFSR